MTDTSASDLTHLIDRRLFALKPGDRVIQINDAGGETERTVKYAPWQLGGGTWVIGLIGIAGGYALHRCRIAEPAATTTITAAQ